MKNLFILATFLFIHLCLKGQSLVNIYDNYNGQASPKFIGVNGFEYSTFRSTSLTNGGYSGEYEVFLNDHLWSQDGSVNFIPDFNSWTKTIQVEVVSFPFTLSCNIANAGCASSLGPARELRLPSGQYNPGLGTWDFLYIKTPVGKFENNQAYFEPICPNPNPSIKRRLTLVSRLFNSNDAWQPCDRLILPHSILKFTLGLICPATTDTVSRQIFYIDNTRGRMKYYPYYPISGVHETGNGGSSRHDITIRPEIIYNNTISNYTYQELNNNSWLDLNSTINYFPYSEITSICQAYYPIPSDDYASNYFGSGYEYSYPFAPPFSLISAYPRNVNGTIFAGYTNGFNINDPLIGYQSTKHSYEIDKGISQGFKIDEINSHDRIIFNPSEVNITNIVDVNNLLNSVIFPYNYSFKTIRAVYPPASQVSLDNIAENGGYFNDPRKVPFRTDLRYEGTTYPNNPAIPAHSVYASIYKMQNGSKVDVKDCVGLFDLTFEVNQGASLVLNNYPNIWGKEQFGDNTLGRYKVLTRKGAVLRNFKHIQYVQNGEITQNYPLQYIAASQIIAGNNVDIEDADAVQGDYEIKADADVIFRAGQSITLKPGFHAQTGSNFLATISVISTPLNCPQQNANPVNTRMATGINTFEAQVLKTENFKLYPNPASGNFSLEYQIDEPAMISIYNSIGNLISEENLSSENKKYEANTGHLKPGIYQYRISGRSGKQLHNGKLVVM